MSGMHLKRNIYQNSSFDSIHQILSHNNSNWFIWKFFENFSFYFLYKIETKRKIEFRNIFVTLISWKRLWKAQSLPINAAMKNVFFYIDESPIRYWQINNKEYTPINSRGNDLCAMKNDMWPNAQNTVFFC